MSKWEGWILGFLHFGLSFCLRWTPALVFLVPPLPFLSIFLFFDLFLSHLFLLSIPVCPSQDVCSQPLTVPLWVPSCSPAGSAHTFSHFPHLCPSHLLCPLSFPFPTPSFLFFPLSLLPSWEIKSNKQWNYTMIWRYSRFIKKITELKWMYQTRWWNDEILTLSNFH